MHSAMTLLVAFTVRFTNSLQCALYETPSIGLHFDTRYSWRVLRLIFHQLPCVVSQQVLAITESAAYKLWQFFI